MEIHSAGILLCSDNSFANLSFSGYEAIKFRRDFLFYFFHKVCGKSLRIFVHIKAKIILAFIVEFNSIKIFYIFINIVHKYNLPFQNGVPSVRLTEACFVVKVGQIVLLNDPEPCVLKDLIVSVIFGRGAVYNVISGFERI